MNPPPKNTQAEAAAPSAAADHAARRRWNKVRGVARRSWSELTTDDFAQADGSLEALYDVIHAKIGGTREDIKARLDQLLI